MEFLTWLRTQWDRAGAVGLALFGLVALLLGWLGASDSPHLAVQIPYFISGGLTGIFLVGSAAALWLSADMRDEWRELRRLRVLLEEERAERVQERSGSNGVGDAGERELTVGRTR
jgi:hypothetical protein